MEVEIIDLILCSIVAFTLGIWIGFQVSYSKFVADWHDHIAAFQDYVESLEENNQ